MTQPLVVLIEDNSVNLELATDLLEAAGFVVEPAQSAETGIELVVSKQPDIVLMDISLPGMDGLEATRILKSRPETKDIPVVALSAHAMASDTQAALDAGCDGYITKPVDTRAFAGQVAVFAHAA